MGGTSIFAYVGFAIIGSFAFYAIIILFIGHREQRQAKTQREATLFAYRLAVRHLYRENPRQDIRDALKAWVVFVGKGEAAWEALDLELSDEAFRDKHAASGIKDAEDLIKASGYPIFLEGKDVKISW